MKCLVGEEVEAFWLKWKSESSRNSEYSCYYSIWRVYKIGYKLLCNIARVYTFSWLTEVDPKWYDGQILSRLETYNFHSDALLSSIYYFDYWLRELCEI